MAELTTGKPTRGASTSDIAAASSLSPARDSLIKTGLIYSAEPHFGRYPGEVEASRLLPCDPCWGSPSGICSLGRSELTGFVMAGQSDNQARGAPRGTETGEARTPCQVMCIG